MNYCAHGVSGLELFWPGTSGYALNAWCEDERMGTPALTENCTDGS